MPCDCRRRGSSVAAKSVIDAVKNKPTTRHTKSAGSLNDEQTIAHIWPVNPRVKTRATHQSESRGHARSTTRNFDRTGGRRRAGSGCGVSAARLIRAGCLLPQRRSSRTRPRRMDRRHQHGARACRQPGGIRFGTCTTNCIAMCVGGGRGSIRSLAGALTSASPPGRPSRVSVSMAIRCKAAILTNRRAGTARS